MTIPPGFSQLSVVHSGPTATGSSPTWTLGLLGDATETGLSDFGVWLAGEYADLLFDLYTVTELRVTNSTGSVTNVAGIPGGRTGSVAPPQCAGLIRKETARLGRGGRGRMYWPGVIGLTELDDQGRITVGVQNDLQDAVDAMDVALVSDGLAPSLLHSDSSDPDPITNFAVERLSSTQRRRLRS